MGKINNHKFIDIDNVSAYVLYEAICKNMNFDNVIELYKLLQHKMTYLADEPRNNCEIGVCVDD